MDSPRSSQLNTHRSSEMDTHRSEGNASNRSIASSSSAENRRSLRVHIEETKALPDELKARMLETLSRDSSSNHSTPDQRTPREPPPPLRGASPWHTTSRVDTPLLAQKRGPAVPVRSVSLGLSEGKAKASDGMPGSKKRKKKLKASLSVEDELAQLAAANRASLARAHAHRVLSLPSSRLLEDSVNSELAFREALAAQLDSLAKQRAAKDVKEFTPEPTPEPSVVDVEREYIQRLRARTPESQLDLRALFLRRLTGDRAPPRGGPDEEGRSRASSAERRELGRSRFAEARPKSSASQNNAVASRGASEGHEAKEKQKPVRLRNMFSSLKSVTAPGKRGWGMPDPGKKKRIARVDYNSDSESVNTLPEKQIADEESPGPKRIPFRTIFAKTSTYSDWVFEHQLEAWKPREVVNGIATPVVVRSPAGTPPQLRTPERQSHRSRAGSPLDFRMEGSKMADGEQRRKKGVKGEVSPRLRLLEGTDSQLFRMEGEELEDELSEMLIAGHGQGKDGSEPGTKAPRFLFPGERDSDAMSADESASEPVVAIGAAIQPEEKPKKKLKKKRSRAKRRSSGPSSELLASIEKARKAKAREMLPSLFPEGGMSDLSRGPPGAKHLPARAHERPPSGGGLGPYSGAAARRGVGRIKTNGNVGGYMGRGGAMGAAHNVSGVGLAAKNGGIVRGPGTGKGSETGTKGMSVRKGGFRASIEGEDSSSSDGESSDDDESEGEAGGENKPETQEGGPENADQGGEENATEGGGEDEETKADEILIDDESVAGDWEEDIGEVAEKPEAAIKGIEKQRVEVPAPMRPRRVGGAGRDEGYDVWQLLRGEAKHTPIYTWGDNVKGQSAAEGPKFCLRPHTALAERVFTAVAAGARHAAALTAAGDLYMWGHNNKGQLGLRRDRNGNGNRSWATPVLLQLPQPVAQIACGAEHTIALLSNGHVFAWGSNECGQLGFDDVEERRIPALVPALSGTESRTGGTETRTAQIACGQQHSAAVLEGGELLTWGCGRSGQLGHASEPSRQAPRRVQALADVFCTQVACGWAHTLALGSDGSVYSWGFNGNGCLGLGHTDNKSSPAKITAFHDGSCSAREPLPRENVPRRPPPPPVQVVQIAAAVVSAAVGSDGRLYVWGADEHVSHPEPANQALAKPLPLGILDRERVTHVGLGNQHAAVVTADGRVITWGNSSIGRLGTEYPVVERVPTSFPVGTWRSVHVNTVKVGGVNKAAGIACGANHTVLLSGEERYEPELQGSNMRDALAAIFEAYCSSTEGAKAVPPQMSKAAWLLFLRECLLYDNSFAHFDAEDIFETAFRSQEEEAGTVLAEFDEDAEPPSWESSVRGSHASRRTSPFRRSDGRRSRSSRDNGRAAESSGSGKSDSEKSESGRRLSDLVTERPESKNSSNSSKSGPRRFRPSREVWFRSSLGAENGQNGRAATPYSTDSVRPMTGQSSLGRPMLDSNASDRPDSAWSSVGRPDSGGSAMTRPETGESAFRQLDSAGSDLRRPMTAANNLRQATPAGSDRGQPKKDLRQRSSEGARAPARAFDDERMLGFEGFKDALWLVSTVLFRHRKELTAVPLAVPATVPLAVPVTVPLVLPPGVSSAGLLSIEDEVDLILDGLIADVVADSHVSSPNSQRGESVRRGNRWETAPVIGFHPVVDHGTRKLSGSVASRGMSRSVDPSGMAERTTTNFAPAKPVETIVGAVRTESDEDAFTRQILGRHVAALEQRVVMDRAFPGIIKPQHFQALQPDIVLLYQLFAYLAEDGNKAALFDESALATRLHVERDGCTIGCQLALQLLRGSGLLSIDANVPRVVEALHLGERPYPRRLQGPRVLLFPEFLETILLCAANIVRPEPQFKGANTLAHRLERTLRALALFKDERLYPEKYYVPLSTEAAVEAEVTLLFSRYCGLGEVNHRVEIDRPAFLRICRDCQLAEGQRLAAADMNLLFLEATKAPPGSNIKITGLSRERFADVLTSIALTKFPDAPDAAAAYRYLVEKHIAPVARRVNQDVADFQDVILENDVTEVFLENEVALRALFASFAGVDSVNVGFTGKAAWGAAPAEAAAGLSAAEFKTLSAKHDLMPNMVTRRRLEVAFRKAKFGTRGDGNYLSMTYSEFLEALSLVSMMAYSTRKDAEKYPSPADKVRALLDFMKIRPKTVGGKKKRRGKAKSEAPQNPWLSLKLDPWSTDRWYWGSSTDFPLCLIREVICAPDAPPSVEAQIERAVYCHTVGKFDAALSAFRLAEELWLVAFQADGRAKMTSEAFVFLGCAMGGVYESMGQDDLALEKYQEAAEAAAKLEAGAPAKVLPTSCLACAYFHRGDFTKAFELFLKTMTFREKEAEAGAPQADLALTYHNMACCLERCGQIHKAIELLEIALLLFQSELGADHPRCHVAARNMARAERKALGLHLPGTKDPKMIPRKSSRPLKLFPLHQKAQQYDHQIRQSIAAALEDEKKKGPRESLESPVSGRVSRKSTNHPSTESGKSPERRMSQAPERRTSEAPDKRMSQMPERNPLVQLLERRMSEAPGRRASEVVEARGVEPGADVAPSWIDASAPNWLVDGRRQSSTQRPGTPDAATFLRQNSSVRQESVAGNLPPIASPRVSTSGTPVAKLEAPQGTGRVSRAEKSTGSVGVKSETSVGRFRIRRFGGSSFR